RIPEQLRPGGADLGKPSDRHPRVVRVAALGARPRGSKELLADGATLERGERRLLRGVLERQEPFAIEMASASSFGCRVDLFGREAREVRLVADDQSRILSRCQQLIHE